MKARSLHYFAARTLSLDQKPPDGLNEIRFASTMLDERDKCAGPFRAMFDERIVYDLYR
jgi:hypothetical protein